MKLETFFEKFDLFADTPDAVAKLRQLVLQLAVQGKLVQRKESDGNAAKIFSEEVPPEATCRYEIADTWIWIRFAAVGEQRLGKMLDQKGNRGELKPYLRNTNVQWMRFQLDDIKEIRLESDELEEYRLLPGDLLICEGGEPGRCAIWRDADREMYFQKAIHRVRPRKGILSEYLAICLQVDAQAGVLAKHFTGATIKHFTGRSLSEYSIPLPPVAEQKRIVAKVDELMTLCDRLEAQQQERETRRAALAHASLARFTDAPTPGNLQFVFHPGYAIPPADLRKSILALAIKGKLVHRIEAEGKGSDILVQAGVSEEPPDDVPELPAHWVWVRLGGIATRMDSGWSPACIPEPAAKGDWGVLKTTAVQSLQYQETQNKALPPNLEPRPEHEVMDGDILFTRAGPTNRVGILCVARPTRRKLMISDKIIRFHLVAGIDPDFAALAMNVGHSSAVVEVLKSGMAASQVNVSQPKLRSVPIPLPPLAEQRRIVAKVEQQMALVDELETQLAASRATAADLLSALVAELTGTTRDGKVAISSVSAGASRQTQRVPAEVTLTSPEAHHACPTRHLDRQR